MAVGTETLEKRWDLYQIRRDYTGYLRLSWYFCQSDFSVCGQALRGTTGLLHAPTADMQQDKTFMLGGNVLDITPLHYYDFDVRYTFNYYLNITAFSLAGSGIYLYVELRQ